MSSKMTIELALANLEAGKFSFRMIDAIKDHVERLENELKVVQNLHADAINDLRQREIANWRLESDLKRANEKIYAVLRANALTEKSFEMLGALRIKLGEFVQLVRNEAIPTAHMLLKAGYREMKPVAAKAVEYLGVAKAVALPKAKIWIHRGFQEMKPVASQLVEGLKIAGKDAWLSLEKATAYLLALRKTGA